MSYDLDQCLDDNPLPEDTYAEEIERDQFLTDGEADQDALDSVYGELDPPDTNELDYMHGGE